MINIKIVIMCGGYYEQWETPKQLQIVNGERIVERTIRLLKENGIKDIVITSNNPQFDELGVPRLEHENSYRYENGKLNGYWLDAFYPKFRKNQKATFIFGDVYFTEDAIKEIVKEREGNVLIGSAGALITNRVWGEPYAYVVNDMGEFYDGIKAVKKLQDEGKTNRVPIVWELYRYLNGIDVNEHRVKPETYIAIDDDTDDADTPQKLEQIRSKVEKKGNVFTVFSLNSIGGGESFLYYLAKKYKDRDITIYYTNGDIDQVERLSRYARVKKYNGEKIRCEKVFFNYNQSYKENIEADEYYQIIHADYYNRKLTPKEDKRMKYIAVSEYAAESFKKQTGKKADICYNPLVIDDRKSIILMSATRLSKGKGKERTEKLANILDANGVSYKWFIFTNDTNAIDNDNIVYLKPTLNVVDYMPMCDIFVQLSSDEAFCYSVAEALSQNKPVLITPCPVFKEIGCNEKNSITVDFNLNDVPIDKIVKGLKPPKYTVPRDKWDKILSNKESTYIPPKENDLVKVRVIVNRLHDNEKNELFTKGQEYLTSRKRAKYLSSKGYVVWT